MVIQNTKKMYVGRDLSDDQTKVAFLELVLNRIEDSIVANLALDEKAWLIDRTLPVDRERPHLLGGHVD